MRLPRRKPKRIQLRFVCRSLTRKGDYEPVSRKDALAGCEASFRNALTAPLSVCKDARARDEEEISGCPITGSASAPGASGARANDAKIRKTVKAHGGKVLFIGVDEKGKYFVLVNMTKVKDPKKLRAALKAAAGEAGIVLKSPAEAEKKPKKQ